MPLPRSYISSRNIRGESDKLIYISAIVRHTLTDPAAAVTNGYSASHAGANGAGSRDMTLGGSLASGGVGRADYARNVVITVTHATAVVAMSGTIYGLDINGDNVTEDWSVTAGGTSKTFTGKKAFASVTRISETVAADASANTVIAGTGTVFGLPAKLSLASAVKELAAGSVVTNGTFVTASTAATDDRRGTYSPSTAPNGSNDYTVWYISDDPENDMGAP